MYLYKCSRIASSFTIVVFAGASYGCYCLLLEVIVFSVLKEILYNGKNDYIVIVEHLISCMLVLSFTVCRYMLIYCYVCVCSYHLYLIIYFYDADYEVDLGL